MTGVRHLYHRTTAELAAQIHAQRRFVSAENTQTAFFSTQLDGQARGYGDAVVELHVPAELFDEETGSFARGGWLDDEFPDGEEHWSLRVDVIEPTWIVPPA